VTLRDTAITRANPPPSRQSFSLTFPLTRGSAEEVSGEPSMLWLPGYYPPRSNLEDGDLLSRLPKLRRTRHQDINCPFAADGSFRDAHCYTPRVCCGLPECHRATQERRWSTRHLLNGSKSRPRYQPRYLVSIPVSSSDAPRGSLDSAKVHHIRTAGVTDSHLARLYGVTVAAVRDARVGDTWADHPTPPDTAPRSSWGRRGSPAARSAADDTADSGSDDPEASV
jgi:hypothetical protein